MKVRQGFVSNSSSSSFCIYGTYVESLSDFSEDYVKKINEKRKEDAIANDWFKRNPDLLPQSEEEWEEYFEEDCDYYDYVAELGLEIYSMDGYGYYVGESWSGIGDDETGKEFKASVEEKIKQLLPEAVCETHSETYPC